MEDQKNNEQFSFIKEKIKEKPINKRRVLYKLLMAVACGILFGLAACGIFFVMVMPRLEEMAKPQPDEVTIPRDPETGEVDEPDMEPQEPENSGDATSNPEQGQGPVYVERDLEASDYQMLQNKLFAIGKQGNRSIVTVTGVTSNTDWFDSAYESEIQASGIIIANNGQELLILTEKKVIDSAEAINITFINDDVVPASLKKYDRNMGIAVISVALSDISEETMGKIDLAVLGNSLTVNQGTVVIAIGSPLGTNYSILSGTITSSRNKVSAWDSNYTIFTTDILGSSSGSGVLLNLNGEVIGLMLPGFSNEGDQNTITALSISQLKGIIENLSNGKDIPYLGMRVSTVTEEIVEEYDLPRGVYIRGVETDIPSPAMNAGLQEADIIVAMDGEEIHTVEQYMQKLHSLNPESTVKITVLRQSGEDYAELEFTATVGVLP